MILQILADARKIRDPGMPKRRSRSFAPTPESCSSAGVAIAPAARMTSNAALARQVSP
jgi:hypothetical protein